MFKIIQGLPQNVMAIDARGRITDSDYRDVLIPLKDKIMARYPAIKMLYVAGKGFKGYEVGAMWDDAVFGLKHWNDFSDIAMVTDVGWLRTAVKLFSPFFPGTVKIFDLADISAAKAWISKRKAPGRRMEPDMLIREVATPAISSIRRAIDKEESRMDADAHHNRKTQRKASKDKKPAMQKKSPGRMK